MHRLKCRNTTDHAEHTSKTFTITMKTVLTSVPFSLDKIALTLELAFFQVQGDDTHAQIYYQQLTSSSSMEEKVLLTDV